MTVMNNSKHLCHEEETESDLLDTSMSDGGEDGGDIEMEVDESLIQASECDTLLGRILEGKTD